MGKIVDPKSFETLARNQIERRRSTRMLTEIPVRLATLSDQHACHMTNISDDGAMLETPAPPPAGTTARLVMGDDMVLCEIIWSRGQLCGIKFGEPLGDEKLGNITRETGKAQKKSGAKSGANLGVEAQEVSGELTPAQADFAATVQAKFRVGVQSLTQMEGSAKDRKNERGKGQRGQKRRSLVVRGD